MPSPRSFSRPKGNCGAVAAEAATVLPVLVLLVAGVLHIGTLLGQLHWLAQTAYQGAYLAAETAEAGREGAASRLMTQLATAHSRREQRVRGLDERSLSVTAPSPEPRLPTVDIRIEGRTRAVWSESLGLKVFVKGPVLVRQERGTMDDEFRDSVGR